MMGKWIHISEKVPLKTERQKCIPDSGVSAQTGPHVPSPKPRKQTAHIETHTSQLASVNPHSFTKLWLGTPTPFMNRTNCHTAFPVGLVPVRPVVYFHHCYFPVLFHNRFNSFGQIIQFKISYFETTGLKFTWRASISLQHQTLSSHFIFLYNHLVHCSRFPENSCSTKKI